MQPSVLVWVSVQPLFFILMLMMRLPLMIMLLLFLLLLAFFDQAVPAAVCYCYFTFTCFTFIWSLHIASLHCSPLPGDSFNSHGTLFMLLVSACNLQCSNLLPLRTTIRPLFWTFVHLSKLLTSNICLLERYYFYISPGKIK